MAAKIGAAGSLVCVVSLAASESCSAPVWAGVGVVGAPLVLVEAEEGNVLCIPSLLSFCSVECGRSCVFRDCSFGFVRSCSRASILVAWCGEVGWGSSGCGRHGWVTRKCEIRNVAKCRFSFVGSG